MKTLLLVAHGSRREGANREVSLLTDTLASRAGGHFDKVSCAFLELAEPSIADGVNKLVEEGASSVLVLPYFLAAGAHVASDIPEAVDACREQHPSIEISVTPYLGTSDALPNLLINLALGETAS